MQSGSLEGRDSGPGYNQNQNQFNYGPTELACGFMDGFLEKDDTKKHQLTLKDEQGNTGTEA